MYPLDGSPLTVASSELMLSAKMPSRVLDVGFVPLEAYTPVPYTVAFVDSGNAICVVLTGLGQEIRRLGDQEFLIF